MKAPLLFLFLFFIKNSKSALPGVMLKFERSQLYRQKKKTTLTTTKQQQHNKYWAAKKAQFRPHITLFIYLIWLKGVVDQYKQVPKLIILYNQKHNPA